jgi:hypothetical protein
MNHWHTVDHLAAGRLAEFKREAAGSVRMRAAASAAGVWSGGDPTASRRRLTLEIRRLTAEFRSVITMAWAQRRHDLLVLVAGWQPPGRSR